MYLIKTINNFLPASAAQNTVDKTIDIGKYASTATWNTVIDLLNNYALEM